MDKMKTPRGLIRRDTLHGFLFSAILGLAPIFSAATAPAQQPGFIGPPPLATVVLPESPDDDDLLTATARAHRPAGPGATAPSTDPRNLEGVWRHDLMLVPQIMTDMYGDQLPLNDAGKKVLERRLGSLREGKAPYLNASAICRPPGQVWLNDLNFPFQIYQSDAHIDLVYEEYHSAWFISLSGKPAQTNGPKPYMGRSSGHWDGNTLVVETNDFRQPMWLDVNGTPASGSAKLTERIRKVFDGHWFLEVVYTLDDPVYYTRSWSWVRTYGWAPHNAIFAEYNCEEQVGDKNYQVQAGFVPEPKD